MERKPVLFNEDEFAMAERFVVELAETRAMTPVEFRHELGALEKMRESLDFQIRDIMANIPKPLEFADALESRRKIEELQKTAVMIDFRHAFLSFDLDPLSYKRFLGSVAGRVDERLYGFFESVGLQNGMLGENTA